MSSNPPTDPTFRSYTSAQAAVYAAYRSGYSPAIFNLIFSHHRSTGGHFHRVLDVGCGPGNATRDLALHFDEAVGTDAGEAMIQAARGIGGETKARSKVRWEVVSAEDFAGVVEGESVDLVTSATAAHWFDMGKFYEQAAKVLKPGGTIAIWTRSSWYPHPDIPNAQKIKDIMLHFEREVLAPYELPGNRLTRDMYDNLGLPWNVSPSISAFRKEDYVKYDFDRDGVLSEGKSFFSAEEVESLANIEKGLATASMVTRWREAHPDLVGTDKDCVRVFVSRLREALNGKEELLTGAATTILLFKKSA